MLPLENLDKKTFKEILRESKKNIHRFSKEWTDENYHDPGITLLEMFTWLTEMQRYYINRVTTNNHKNFLKMYGVDLKKRNLSNAFISFSNISENRVVLKGTKLLAEDQVFETTKSLQLTKNKVKKLITLVGEEEIDNSNLNTNKNSYYYGFGENLKIGNSLFIGFDEKFQKEDNIEIFFNINTDYPIDIKGENIYKYGIKGRWYAYTNDDLWEELNVNYDETDLFNDSGVISLKSNKNMKKKLIDISYDSLYWLKFEVESFGVHVSPRINNICFNTIKAVNIHHYCKNNIFHNCQEIKLDEYLLKEGINIFQYKQKDSWIDIEEKDIEYEEDRIVLDKKYNELRVISYFNQFKNMSILGSSTGLSSQSFQVKISNILPESFTLQIGQLQNNKMHWKDFSCKEDLISSSSKDRHFYYEALNDLIHFGNGENGIIPFEGQDNIRIISLAVSNAERGNVKKGEINGFYYQGKGLEGVSVKNIDDAVNGFSGMQIEDGVERVIEDFHEIYRAVTAKDYEEIVKNIPGIRISFVKAVANKNNAVIIVVVPFSEKLNPVPDKKLLKIVENHLEDYRLITTKVVGIKPVYIEIFIKCMISTTNNNKFDKEEFEQKIKNYLSPITPQAINADYKIGMPVYKGEILKLINEFEGVRFVKKLWIDAKGSNIDKDVNGNIYVPYNGIYYCKEVSVDLLD